MRRALALLAMAAVSLLFHRLPSSRWIRRSRSASTAHTAWTVRDGFSLGNVFAMAQTPDGYLWLGNELDCFASTASVSSRGSRRRASSCPEKNINSLLVTRDGTLWIGTFDGLASWSDGQPHRPP